MSDPTYPPFIHSKSSQSTFVSFSPPSKKPSSASLTSTTAAEHYIAPWSPSTPTLNQSSHSLNPSTSTPSIPLVGQSTDKTTSTSFSHPTEATPPGLGKARKTVLLCVFAMASSLDIMQVSGLMTTTEVIARDLELVAGNVIWIMTAYSMTFASFLLFCGRLSDLVPAQWIFQGGFVGLGVLTLISSFVTNKFAFLILRALTGISAAMTLPSAYHLIVHVFPERQEQQEALAMIGMAAAITNSLGVVLGGLFELGKSDWRYLFRFFSILAFTSSLISHFTLPSFRTLHPSPLPSPRALLKTLDLPGVALLTASLLLFILALTTGTVKGFRDVGFYLPLVLAAGLFVGFFLWERFGFRKGGGKGQGVMPWEYWARGNLKILVFVALSPYMFWAPTQLGFAIYWQQILLLSPILVAARLLPQGIAGLVGGGVTQVWGRLLGRPKWTVLGGLAMGMVGLVLLIFSDGGRSDDYWKFVFTGYWMGSFGTILVFLALNVAIVRAMPTESSGVAGALYQTTLQIGSVIGLAVQAGLYASAPTGIADWRTTQRGLWFVFVWLGVTGVGFWWFYVEDDEEEKAKELNDAGGRK